MLRRFLKDSVERGQLHVAMDAIPGLAEEMVDARLGRRHVKVRGEWNRVQISSPTGAALSRARAILL